MSNVRGTTEPPKTAIPSNVATPAPTRAATAQKATEAQLVGAILSEELAARAAHLREQAPAQALMTEVAVQQGVVLLDELKTGELMSGVRPSPGVTIANEHSGADFQSLGLAVMSKAQAEATLPSLSTPLQDNPRLQLSLGKLADAQCAKLIETSLIHLSQSVAVAPSVLRYVSGPGKTHLEALVRETGQFQKVLRFASGAIVGEKAAGAHSQITAVGQAAAKALYTGAFPSGVEPDIDMLVQLVFSEIAKDAADDLRALLKDMSATLKKKAELRELHHRQTQDENHLRTLAADELHQLQKDGLVSSKVTDEEWLKARSFVAGSPVLDEAGNLTGWLDGELAAPSPPFIPMSMRPDSLAPATDHPFQQINAAKQLQAQQVLTADQKQQAQKDPFHGHAPKVGDDKLPKSGNAGDIKLPKIGHAGDHKLPKSGEAGDHKLPKIGKTTDHTLPKIGRETAGLATAEDGANAAAPVSRAPASFAEIQGRNEETKNQQDALSDLTEPAQMRLQQYMERRSKAFEMCSNLFKKLSDTRETMIKNLA